MIPLMRRQLPAWDEIRVHISKVENFGQYSNFGILHSELQGYLANRYGASVKQVALTSSATLALSLCISYYKHKNLAGAPFKVLMPSWTFAATGHSALFLGCEIIFLDVEKNGELSPERVRQAVLTGEVGGVDLILPVIPFGRKYSPRLWEDLSNELGIPIVIDCAAGFSSAVLSTIPTIVSTHATKYFPTAEGGFIMCKDESLVEAVCGASNFGFSGSRSSSYCGTNAKMSEYHAAVGIAYAVNRLGKADVLYRQQASEYFGALENSHFEPFANSIDIPVSTFNVRLPASAKQGVIDDLSRRMLSEYGIESRRWWQVPLHKQPAFRHCIIVGRLDNTLELSDRVLGIPIGDQVSSTAISHIVNSLLKAYKECCV